VRERPKYIIESAKFDDILTVNNNLFLRLSWTASEKNPQRKDLGHGLNNYRDTKP
jgi:hypothetical protein